MENFDYPLSPRIQELKEKRKRINKDMRLDFERNRIITEYYKTHMHEYPILKRAGYLYTWLTTREINIDDDDIFLGDGGPHCRTVHFDIEQTPVAWIEGCFGDTDERFKAAWQVPGSVWVSDEDRAWILEAAEFWKDNDIAATAMGLFPEDFVARRRTMGRGMSGTFPGHFCPGYERAVMVSFGECRKIAQEKLDAIRKNTTAENVRSELFYRAYIKVCDGMILMSKRYAEGCRKKAEETADPVRKAELLKRADSCDWIVEHPARTLWEGIQALFFYQYLLIADGVHWADSPGLIDRFLGPLAEKEIAEGTLTREQAQELFDAFVLHIGDQIIMFPKPTNDRLIEAHKNGKCFFDLQGGAQNIAAGSLITIGGQTPDGTAGTYNIATEMILLGYYRLRVAEPSLALRINQYTPDRIWAIAIACSIRSGGIPQFNNDDKIIEAMLKRGVPIEDARQYAVFGCVEPAISGKEWSMAANCGAFGAGAGPTSILQYVIHGNYDPMWKREGELPCKKLYEYESFEELKAEFERQAKHYIDAMSRLYHFAALVFDTAWPVLSASMMLEGCLETGRDVSITFDGKGKSIEERRAFYASSTSPNIFSSAPMLIDDFDPVGERFVDPKYGQEDFDKLQYEDPIRHQGVRHPRSAVAKTKDNHLLLVAVDGRRPAVSEGMSARELTRFLVKYFHPQYALNMDGGGSTTLCVRGQGDPETNVVNYPTDNEKYDHAGVRNVRTHFLVVETSQNTDIK